MARVLSRLPVGAKVVDKDTKYNGMPITWVIGGHNHYAQGQTVLVSEKIISLKPFDAKEPSNTDSDRKAYGNNRYSVSNIRQWLNSDKTSWYSPQHSADAPPTNANVWNSNNDYDQEAGLLTNFSANLRNALIPTSLTVAKNTSIDGGGSEMVTDKVFLLSTTEVGLANANGIEEGKLLPLFTTVDSSRLAYPTAEAVSKSEYAYANLATSKAWGYWMRSPFAEYPQNPLNVDSFGTLKSDNACRGQNGIRPALNLPSVIEVSDDVNSNGEYEIIYPYLTPSDHTDLGSVTDNTSILKYTPIDSPVGTTVTEKINGVTVGTKTIISGTEYTVSATTAQWNAVKYGKYKDTVGNRNAVTLEISTGKTYTYPFTKTLPTNAKTDEVVMAVNDMSNTAMPSHKKKLVDAIGNKATVGGTGSLEDIAKAIESISVESLGGMKVAMGSFKPVNARASVRGLAFRPRGIIYGSPSSIANGVDFIESFPKDNFFYYAVSFGQTNSGASSSTSMTPYDDGFDIRVGETSNTTTYNYIVFG